MLTGKNFLWKMRRKNIFGMKTLQKKIEPLQNFTVFFLKNGVEALDEPEIRKIKVKIER